MNALKKSHVEALFLLADLPALKIWRLPNQYFTYRDGESEEETRDNAVYRESRPSWLVKTPAGLIELNLRKRVLEIDWSDTQLRVTPGQLDETTKSEFYIHAWTELKAAEYLKDIATAYREKNESTLERSEILPGKGITRCNRTACQRELITTQSWWNKVTLAYYCQQCAFRINESSPLCIRESEKNESTT